MTTEPLPFDGGETPYIDDGMDAASAEYETEYTAQLERVSALKHALARIQAIAKANNHYQAMLLIEGYAEDALRGTYEPLVPDESERTE